MNDDIVNRLRNWVIAFHALPVSDLLEEAATEIERLRQVSPQQNLTLTDEQKEAIRMARSIMLVEHDLSVGEEFNGKQPRKSSGYWWGLSDALRTLLESMK